MGIKDVKLRSVSLSLVVMSSLLAAAGCGTGSSGSGVSSSSKSPINIGMIAALTGNNAVGDVYAWQGVEMAIKQIDQQGGIDGRQVSLIKVDSDDNNTTAVNGLNKLLSENPTGIITTNVSPQISAMMQQIKRADLPTMIGGSSNKLTTQGLDNLFRVRPNNGVVASQAAKFMIANGAKKVGILYVQGDFGEDGLKALESTFAAAGINPVAVQSHTPDAVDFTSQLLNISKAGAQWLVTWSNPVPEGELMKQIHELHLNMKVMLSPAASLESTLKLAPAADSNGDYVALEALPTSNVDPKVKQWVQQYESEFNNTVPNFESVSYYDGMMMLAQAMKTVGTDPAKINQYLHQLKNYQGIGHTYSFDSQGDGVQGSEVGIIQNQDIQVVN